MAGEAAGEPTLSALAIFGNAMKSASTRQAFRNDPPGTLQQIYAGQQAKFTDLPGPVQTLLLGLDLCELRFVSDLQKTMQPPFTEQTASGGSLAKL